MFAPKIGSCLSGRGQPVRPVLETGQTGFTVADLAMAETGLTDFSIRSDRFTPSWSRIRSPSRFQIVKEFLAGQDLLTL